MERADAEVLRTIAAVRRACVAAGEADPLDEAADLLLKNHGLAGVEVIASRDDTGFAFVHGEALELGVRPEARRRGHGGALLRSVLTHAADAPLGAWSHGDHPAAAALAARHGFERVRELWVMRRPVAVPLEKADAPLGVTIRGFAPTQDADAFLVVNAAAFADHPEQGGLDAAGLAERMAEPWFDPAGLLLAIDDTSGELLGFHWTKRHDADHGEVYVLGIAPGAQGRGLGRTLTVAGLEHLAALGVREVILYVEADNGPAVNLYRNLGFTHSPADTHVRYLRS